MTMFRISRDGETQHVNSLDGYPTEGEEAWTVEAEFEDDLNRLRDDLWNAVKAKRALLINGGIDVTVGEESYRLQSDLESRINILAASLVATQAHVGQQPFATHWKMADNSVVALDGQEMIQLGVTAANFASACHDRARTLYDAIFDEEADAEDLAAIDIEAGWPE